MGTIVSTCHCDNRGLEVSVCQGVVAAMTYGHSRRSLNCPQGNTKDWRIQCSNMLVINMMVILTILRARRCQFCIEQPSSSRIGAGRNLRECGQTTYGFHLQTSGAIWNSTQSWVYLPGFQRHSVGTTSRHPVQYGIRPHGNHRICGLTACPLGCSMHRGWACSRTSRV
jgi:hypothetical protein